MKFIGAASSAVPLATRGHVFTNARVIPELSRGPPTANGFETPAIGLRNSSGRFVSTEKSC
jgi:hypothetical protein